MADCILGTLFFSIAKIRTLGAGRPRGRIRRSCHEGSIARSPVDGRVDGVPNTADPGRCRTISANVNVLLRHLVYVIGVDRRSILKYHMFVSRYYLMVKTFTIDVVSSLL